MHVIYSGWQSTFWTSKCGFRPSRSAVDARFSLRRLCNEVRDKGQTLHTCILYLTKASESVDRDMAGQILLTRGAPPQLIALIRDLHTHHSAVIRSELTLSQLAQVLVPSKDMCSLTLVQCLSWLHLPATATAAAAWHHHMLQDRLSAHALQESHREGADVDSAVC